MHEKENKEKLDLSFCLIFLYLQLSISIDSSEGIFTVTSKPKGRNAISPTRTENYPEWYQQVVKAADLAENSPVRGCMVIKPWGYGIWENIQKALDHKFKETGHQNAYFPLLIPLSFLQKEATHVEGFAKECAVVTHHRLEADADGKLHPAGELDEPFVIRPTSETIIGDSFSRWVQSYRDLPLLINQWANIMRWEMRTRLFLRTSEILWQEGHTAHATEEEAQEETLRMLHVYEDFARDYMAVPLITGKKTPDERFPGAVETYTIEAMMQDRKALQAGTSHFLGQNFAKASEIKFLDPHGEMKYAWTTSWGVTTRLIGAIVMVHSDDDGLVLPPMLAPRHIVILPIYKAEDRTQVMEYCENLKKALAGKTLRGMPIYTEIDDRDIRGGEKVWQHIKKGTPLRVEVGPRDMQADSLFLGQRNVENHQKRGIPRLEFLDTVESILGTMQDDLYAKAKKFQLDNIHDITDLATFEAFFAENAPGGFARCHWSPAAMGHPLLQKLKVTPRCLPLNQEPQAGVCLFSGEATTQRVIFAKAY